MSSPELRFCWKYLCQASRASLQSLELARLGRAADLRKQISILLDEWLEETSAAMLARWLIDNGDRFRATLAGWEPPDSPESDLMRGLRAKLPAPLPPQAALDADPRYARPFKLPPAAPVVRRRRNRAPPYPPAGREHFDEHLGEDFGGD